MTSKIVIKDITKWPGAAKIFKIVKKINYPRIELMDQTFDQDELKKFIKGLPGRITYEVLGDHSRVVNLDHMENPAL
jgi:hypothetical protein